MSFIFISSAISQTIIKLGYSTNSQDPRGAACLLFKNEVEKNSKGKIIIDIYDNGKLGSDTQLIEGVINGNIDMTVSSAGNFAAYSTDFGISALPFLFTDFITAWNFIDSSIVRKINKELEVSNIVVLAYYDNGFRCITTTNKPITKVADMQGLKIRTPPNQIVIETMSALGANPETLDFGELIDALKAGRFDGEENPIPVIYNNKLYTVQKYLAVTNHSYDAMPLVIRKDLWDTLSASLKKAIKDAALKSQAADRKIVKEQTETLVAKLKAEGMTITQPDVAEFAASSKKVFDKFSEVYGQELMNSVKSFTR